MKLPKLKHHSYQTLASEDFLRKMLGGVILILLFAAVIIAAVQRAAREQEKDLIGEGVNRASYASGARVRILQQRPEGGYQLLPDRRFLYALAEISRLYGLEPPAVLRVNMQEGKWSIRADDKAVGTLDELPDESDLMTLLLQHLRVLEGTRPINLSEPDREVLPKIETQLESFFAPSIALPLKKLDALWVTGDRSKLGAQLALRGLLFLLLQVDDSTELADGLGAKALALLTVLRAVSYVSPEECLVLSLLSYSAAADRCATALPGNDPVKLFLSRDDSALKNVAEGPSGNAFNRYLYLLRLKGSDSPGAVNRWVEKYYGERIFDPAILRVYAADAALPEQDAVTNSMPFAVVSGLLGQVGDPLPASHEHHSITDALQSLGELERQADALEGAVKKFESGLRRLPLGSVFSGAEVYVDYYRAAFYSALLHSGSRLLNARGAAHFADSLGAGRDALTVQFRSWYQLLLRQEPGEEGNQHLLGNMGTSPLFGAPLRAIALDTLVRESGHATVLSRRGALAFFDSADSRPNNRMIGSRFLREEVFELSLADKLARSVIELDPLGHEMDLVEFAAYSEDTASLDRLSMSERSGGAARLAALQALSAMPGTLNPTLAERYRLLRTFWPENVDILVTLSTLLSEQGKGAEARTMLQEWLSTRAGKRRNDVLVRRALSRTYSREKKFADAWKALALGDALDREETLLEGVRVLQELGKLDEAEAMARQATFRFPRSAEARVEHAQVLWRQGKYSLATGPILGISPPLAARDWREGVAPAFLRFTRASGSKKAEEAFEVLRRQGPGNDLLQLIPTLLAREDLPDLAFRFQVKLMIDAADPSWAMMQAYRYAKQAKGQAAALDWLRERLTATSGEDLAAALLHGREHELLWDSSLFGVRTADDDYLWCARAAAYVLDSARFASRKAELLKATSADRSRKLYPLITRYLLGAASREDVLSATYDKKSKAETSYYFALRSIGEHRYAEAIIWLQDVLNTANKEQREYGWAAKTLTTWVESGKTLRLLEKAGVY